jgi:hypothetical protein
LRVGGPDNPPDASRGLFPAASAGAILIVVDELELAGLSFDLSSGLWELGGGGVAIGGFAALGARTCGCVGVSVADCEFDREGPAPGELFLSGVVDPPRVFVVESTISRQ